MKCLLNCGNVVYRNKRKSGWFLTVFVNYLSRSFIELVAAAAVEFISADTVQFPKHETQTMMHRKPPCTTSNARSYHSSYFTWPHLNLSQLISYRTRPCDVMRPSSSWLRPITAHSVQTKWGQFEMVWGEISDCTVHKSLSYNKRRF